MAITKDDLRAWFDEGVKQGATHMIVVCDTFSYEDYPVYVRRGQKASEVTAELDGKDMCKVMEVYKLSLDREKQVAGKHRVLNY